MSDTGTILVKSRDDCKRLLHLPQYSMINMVEMLLRHNLISGSGDGWIRIIFEYPQHHRYSEHGVVVYRL